MAHQVVNEQQVRGQVEQPVSRRRDGGGSQAADPAGGRVGVDIDIGL